MSGLETLYVRWRIPHHVDVAMKFESVREERHKFPKRSGPSS